MHEDLQDGTPVLDGKGKPEPTPQIAAPSATVQQFISGGGPPSELAKKRKHHWGAFFLVVLLLLSGGAGAYYYYYGNPFAPKPNAQASPTAVPDPHGFGTAVKELDKSISDLNLSVAGAGEAVDDHAGDLSE